MTRDEQLAECKKRAFEYVDAGDDAAAVASMANDVMKYSETKINENAMNNLIAVAMLRLMDGDRRGIRAWIEGFR